MPKAMEEALKRQVSKHKGWSQERKDSFVYGTMRKTGWMPSTQKENPRAKAMKKRLSK